MPKDFFLAAWKWAVPSAATSRVDNSPHEAGKNYVTVIDGFLVSPGVDVRSVVTIPLGFRDSDHEPVVIEVAAHTSKSNSGTAH